MTTYWTWLTILVFLVGAAVAWTWKWGAAPAPIRLTSPSVARDVFRMLLTNGAKGATLRLQAEADAAAKIEFKKYIRAPGKVGLSALIDDTTETRAAYDAIAKAFPDGAVPKSPAPDDRRRRLEVDIGMDVSLAERLARQAFEDGLGLNLARDVIGYYDLVLLRNVPRLTGVETD